MSDMVKDLKTLGAVALGFVVLAITVVLGVILLTEFKSVGIGSTTTNNTIDVFIAAILIFGSFSSVLALVAMVKIIVRVVRAT